MASIDHVHILKIIQNGIDRKLKRLFSSEALARSEQPRLGRDLNGAWRPFALRHRQRL